MPSISVTVDPVALIAQPERLLQQLSMQVAVHRNVEVEKLKGCLLKVAPNTEGRVVHITGDRILLELPDMKQISVNLTLRLAQQLYRGASRTPEDTTTRK